LRPDEALFWVDELDLHLLAPRRLSMDAQRHPSRD
jgi:hypothetical protein